MTRIDHRLIRSFARSRKRRAALRILARKGEAYPAQLARACRVSVDRVSWIVRGRAPYYRVELSLVALGLAREERLLTGPVYRVTQRGRRAWRALERAEGRR